MLTLMLAPRSLKLTLLNSKLKAPRLMCAARFANQASAKWLQFVVVQTLKSNALIASSIVSAHSRFKTLKVTKCCSAKCATVTAAGSTAAWVLRQSKSVLRASILKQKTFCFATSWSTARVRRRPAHSSVSRWLTHSSPPPIHQPAWCLTQFQSFHLIFAQWFNLMVAALRLPISTIFTVV